MSHTQKRLLSDKSQTQPPCSATALWACGNEKQSFQNHFNGQHANNCAPYSLRINFLTYY